MLNKIFPIALFGSFRTSDFCLSLARVLIANTKFTTDSNSPSKRYNGRRYFHSHNSNVYISDLPRAGVQFVLQRHAYVCGAIKKLRLPYMGDAYPTNVGVNISAFTFLDCRLSRSDL